MIIKRYLAFNFLLFVHLILDIGFSLKAQNNLDSLLGKELHNKVRLNFIPVSMPSEKYQNLKPVMGMMGLHYQVYLSDWLYTGVGMYGAVTGDQGGLFTLGIELGINKKLYKNLYFDTNLHFGGGGGYRYLVNDGGFLNPNIGLQYKKKGYSFGIQFSHVNFYSGEMKSNSVSFLVEIPSILRFADYTDAHKKFISNNLSEDNFWKHPSIKNIQQLRFDFFNPIGNSRKDNGNSLTETLYVLGFEYQKYLNENTFIFAHTDAIYKGLRAGFMDLFFGTGYHPYQSNSVNLFTKLAIGAAGGRVAPEGGLMVYPSMGVTLKFSKHLALSGHTGYYRAVIGDLEAYTYGFGIKYLSNNGGINDMSNNPFVKTRGITLSIENQSYFEVVKTDDPDNLLLTDLQLLALQFNYDISKNFYLVGEAGFTYSGRSGGYAHGLTGLGIKTSNFFKNKLNLFTEIAVGAAGGAGVDTGEGIVVRPTVGFNYNINKNFSLTASGGNFYAPFGKVNSTNINVGLNFSFASLSSSE